MVNSTYRCWKVMEIYFENETVISSKQQLVAFACAFPATAVRPFLINRAVMEVSHSLYSPDIVPANSFCP
jgi:hypothetical protein